MNLRGKLTELERRADAVLGDRPPCEERPVFYIPDNGRGDGLPTGRHGQVVIYQPEQDEGPTA